MESEKDLSSFILHTAPPTIIYIPEFVNEEEEKYLLNRVNNSPKPKWTQLKNRRLQNWGGFPHIKGMVKERMPDWLQCYTQKVNELGVFDKNHYANHVLINEYLPGQGIMPHLDGPLYYPTICTISLGSHTILNFYELLKSESENIENSELSKRYVLSLLLEPRSLVIIKDNMYNQYLHGIEEITDDVICKNIININTEKYEYGNILSRGTRTSLTIRNVPKTIKCNLIV